MLEYGLGVERLALAGHHGEADALAEPRIGDREGRRLLDSVMAQRQRLDARRINVPPATDDHILLAADDAQITVVVKPAEIAGHEPALRVKRRFRCRLIVEITEHQAGAAAADLADLTG